jgi:shikimate kinase
MGSGKTTVGRHLAGLLGRRFVDLDAEIERRQGMAVAEIFRARGEAAFRAAETELLEALPAGGDAVVALGGGTLLQPANSRRVEALGPLVWLECPLDVALARCGRAGERPLLDGRSDARELLGRRLPGYRAANLRLAAARSDPEELARQVADWVIETAADHPARS